MQQLAYNRVEVIMTITAAQNQMSFSTHFQLSLKIESIFFKFFDFLTISPVRVTKASTGIKIKLSESAPFWSFFAVICTLIYIASIIILRVFYFQLESEVGVWNEITSAGCILLTCIAILIETQFTHKYFADFLHLKQKTEDELLALCNREIFEYEKYVYVKYYQKMILSFFIIVFIKEIINLFNPETDELWKFYSWCLLIPTTFTRLRYFQHRLLTNSLLFYIKMIRIKIQSSIDDINNEEAVAREQRLFQITANSRKILDELNSAMRILTSIYRMTYLMNKIFGLSLLVSVFENFNRLLTYLFWLYSKLYRHEWNNSEGLNLHCLLLMFN